MNRKRDGRRRPARSRRWWALVYVLAVVAGVLTSHFFPEFGRCIGSCS